MTPWHTTPLLRAFNSILSSLLEGKAKGVVIPLVAPAWKPPTRGWVSRQQQREKKSWPIFFVFSCQVMQVRAAASYPSAPHALREDRCTRKHNAAAVHQRWACVCCVCVSRWINPGPSFADTWTHTLQDCAIRRTSSSKKKKKKVGGNHTKDQCKL